MAFNRGNVLESGSSGGLADNANARRVQLRGIDPTCWTHSAREQHGELSASGPDVGNSLAGAQLERLGEPGASEANSSPWDGTAASVASKTAPAAPRHRQRIVAPRQ